MPSASCCFLLVFLLHRKSIPNRVQTQRNFMENFSGPEDTRWAKEVPEGGSEGSTTHQGAPMWVVPTLVASRTASSPYKFPNIPKNPRGNPRSEVPLPQASVATRNQSRPHFGSPPEGGTIFGGHLRHPGGHHDEEGVVHPWG